MQEEPTPTFAEQVRQAVDRGQVVLITPPARRPNPRPAPAMPLHRSEAALIVAFCLLFKLTRGESQVLVRLATCDYSTKEALLAAAACGNQTVAQSTVSVAIHKLRKKLKPHNIEITTLYRLGYGLGKNARARIGDLLARYDTGVLSTHAAPNSKPAENDQPPA